MCSFIIQYLQNLHLFFHVLQKISNDYYVYEFNHNLYQKGHQ